MTSALTVIGVGIVVVVVAGTAAHSGEYQRGLEDAAKVVDAAYTAWGDIARSSRPYKKGEIYTAYAVAALDLKGRIDALAKQGDEEKEDG